MFTRNDWYVACTEDELGETGPIPARVLDQPLVLWRSGDKLVALEDRCVHRAAALSLGRCEGANLRCMYHGLLFNEAGLVVEIPGQDIIPPTAKVRAYPATTRHGWVWVWMGDPAKADLALVPNLFKGVDIDDFGMGGGVLEFDANANLISDNLLDFSHLAFVHEKSFQAPLDWAKSTMKMEQMDRGMRFERWLEDQPGTHFLDDLRIGPCDEWLGYDYLIPGVLIMWVGYFPPGTARALNHGRPDFSQAIGRVSTNLQAITPISDRKSRYYFIIGLYRKDGAWGQDAALVQRNVDVTIQAFNEDKRVIEAQQRILDREPDRTFMPTVHDRGVTLYNRIKARRIAAEAEPARADEALLAK